MNKLTDFQTQLMLNVFTSNESIVKFINSFKEVQRNRIKMLQMGHSVDDCDSKFSVPGGYYQMCAVYLIVAKMCMDAESVNGIFSDELKNLDFELVMFTDGMNDLSSVLDQIGVYSRAGAESKEIMLFNLVRLITTSGYLIHESELLLNFIDDLGDTIFSENDEVATAYEAMKKQHQHNLLVSIATANGVNYKSLVSFYDKTITLSAVDGVEVSDLFTSESLGWKERIQKVNNLIVDMLDALRLAANLRDIKYLRLYLE